MLPADIARTRRALGLTQQQFAEVCGLTHWNSVHRWESGTRSPYGARTPVLEALHRLVEIMEERDGSNRMGG
jgi:DNA-binding transcriptional regulator YiaG